ncbi:MAG: hypothetical protein KIT09_27610 [Bryobacteraceae bacterium]|nr:hypothetical protein [Bryobacteraceae bacterium]
MVLPRMLKVRQHFPDRRLNDIPKAVTEEMARAALGKGLAAGSSIAIGVGSRGIANIATIVRAAVDHWKARGMRPFIFPAMGSHGAATAEGQAQVLAHYGICESTMGCPVRSQLNVVSTGRSPEGIDTYVDRLAYESDGILVVGRVKSHTDFEGRIESGLFKMMAIGLGKFAGAERYHTVAYKMGLENVVLSVGQQVLRSGKVLGGLAIVEDAGHETAKVSAVAASEMEEREAELLTLAKQWRGQIPVQALDILIIDEMGKNISGTGIDTKVINRQTRGAQGSWYETPQIERVYVRGITELSYGSAVGVGLADVVSDRLVRAIDWGPTLLNCLTASNFSAARLPAHFETDRECLARLYPSVGRLEPREVTLGWIHNTLELGRIMFSENLRPEIEGNPALEIVGPAEPLSLDTEGNLEERLASSEEW